MLSVTLKTFGPSELSNFFLLFYVPCFCASRQSCFVVWMVSWNLMTFTVYKALLSEMSSYCSWAAFCICKGLNLVWWSADAFPDNSSNPAAQSRHNFLNQLKFLFRIPPALWKNLNLTSDSTLSETLFFSSKILPRERFSLCHVFA